MNVPENGLTRSKENMMGTFRSVSSSIRTQIVASPPSITSTGSDIDNMAPVGVLKLDMAISQFTAEHTIIICNVYCSVPVNSVEHVCWLSYD